MSPLLIKEYVVPAENEHRSNSYNNSFDKKEVKKMRFKGLIWFRKKSQILFR